MPKVIEQWLLFEYVGLEFTPLSKPFKTREQAEKAREKYPEPLRKRIGVGVIRTKNSCSSLRGYTGIEILLGADADGRECIDDGTFLTECESYGFGHVLTG